MIEEGLRALKEMIEERRVVEVRGEVDRTTFQNCVTGEFYVLRHNPVMKTLIAGDLESFVSIVEGYSHDASVWITEDEVECVLDEGDDHRRDRARLSLRSHPAMRHLMNPVRRSVKGFQTLLKIDLHGCEFQPSDIAEVTSRVRFQNDNDSEAASTHGDESVSVSLRKQVSGAGDIPERVLVRFPMYPALHDMTEVKESEVVCAVIVDADSKSLMLQPLPGEVDNAIRIALSEIQVELQGRMSAGVSIYIGVP